MESVHLGGAEFDPTSYIRYAANRMLESDKNVKLGCLGYHWSFFGASQTTYTLIDILKFINFS